MDVSTASANRSRWYGVGGVLVCIVLGGLLVSRRSAKLGVQPAAVFQMWRLGGAEPTLASAGAQATGAKKVAVIRQDRDTKPAAAAAGPGNDSKTSIAARICRAHRIPPTPGSATRAPSPT